jgi:DNA-binding NarL/FixJ family response regulator
MNATNPTHVRVVIADDHTIWRSGVRADLGEIRRHKPDLVLCDLHMPDGGGLRVPRECGDDTILVILTVSEAERDLLEAVSAGAQG